MDKQFYEIAEALDRLKEVADPSELEVAELSGLLTGVEYVRYFFHELENPGWVMPLHQNGNFNTAPPTQEDESSPGYFSMPTWHEGEFLNRVADQFPQVVKEVALGLVTENSRAIRTMLDALVKIPPEILAEAVEAFDRWLATPFVGFMSLAHEVGIIMERLARSNQVDAALHVLEVLSTPFGTADPVEEDKVVAGSRHDYYWLEQAFHLNLPALLEVDPMGVVEVLESQLVAAIDLEHDPHVDDHDKPMRSFWRLNIDPSGDLNYRKDLKNLLVNQVITGLDRSLDESADEATEKLANYLGWEYEIFRRIAAYTLRKWGGSHPELLAEAYQRFESEPLNFGQSEFQTLIDTQFGNLPKHVQEQILASIRGGPDRGWAEELLRIHPDQYEGETVDEKIQSIVESWQLHQLDRIASDLQGDDKELYERLRGKFGKPEPSPEVGVVTSWEGPESPIDHDELAAMEVAEVVRLLVDYSPTEEGFVPSREGLGRTLQSDVQNRPNEYAENAQLFADGALHFVYHSHFFTGLEAALKSDQQFALAEVVSLTEFVTAQEMDPFPKQELEPGLPNAKLAAVGMIEELLRSGKPTLEGELLYRIGQVIIRLLDQQDPFLSEEEQPGFDSATRSINSIRGRAMHTLIWLGLYFDRKGKEVQGDKWEPAMVPLVKDALNAKLDKSNDPSLAVHSVFGWHFPRLHYLDSEWAREKRDQIFPLEPTKKAYFQAAWSAYIRFSNVYKTVFPDLIACYRRALEEVLDEHDEQGWERIDERLATHLLQAYLAGLIDLDSKDDLMSVYFDVSDDETRSQGNFWLSKIMESERPSEDDATWRRIWKLWQWRLKEATAAKDQAAYVKEISSFCRLLKYVPLTLPELYRTLEQTLEFAKTGFELQLIIEYLGMNSELSPDLATSLLHEIVLSDRSLFLTTDTRSNVERILTVAVDADNKTKAMAIEIINVLGQRGDYEWRPLLDQLNWYSHLEDAQ